MAESRSIALLIEPQTVIEGAGVHLRRSFGPHVSNPFDPFLLFDHFHFKTPVEGTPVGFPMHPHRGIETVTYMLEGSVHHRDSLGNAGLIGPGDVQWMTSGRGIMHEEMPRRGPSGIINGFQLWVNLPAALKMTVPRYQEVRQAEIPMISKDGVNARLVAGIYAQAAGPVSDISAAPAYIDFYLEPSASLCLPVQPGHTLLAYVYDGEAAFGPQEEHVDALGMIKFTPGDQLDVFSATGVRFLLISGAPFNEPIAPYGPFVMNTQEEIRQAFMELRNGTFIR